MNDVDARAATGSAHDHPTVLPAASADRAKHLRIRQGAPQDAPAIVRLIDENQASGHLLPRSRAEVERHVGRFIVLADEDAVVGCAELAPLSLAVAEVRSLVVEPAWRGLGLGTQLVESLRRQARLAGFSTLCALTHDPSHFVRLGFSIVPHVWFPEKIATDCESCSKFRVCGQHAVALALDAARLDRPGTSHRRLPMAATAAARAISSGQGRAGLRNARDGESGPAKAARR